MHLAEAFLATLSVRDDAPTQAALLALAEGMQQRFVEPVHNVMLEKPREAVDNWFEPGHQFEAMDENLMLKSLPGVFCAGEMLDWEAPTGGYLLTGCFASGRAAGLGVLSWLKP